MGRRSGGVPKLERVEAIVENPAIYQLAGLIPAADLGRGGRRRQYPEYMWLIYEALLSVYGSARQVEAELSHPVVWDLLGDRIRRQFPKDPSLWLPAAPMRRHHYLYARNRYLTDPNVLAAITALHRVLAAHQARELGLLDPDGPGSWTHPDLSRMLHADGKVITPLFRARPGETQLDTRTGELRPLRADPDGGLHVGGPSLHPTAARRFFVEQPGVRSRRTVDKWGWVLRALQRRCPQKRVSEFTEEDLLAFLTYGEGGAPRANAAATIISYRVCLTSFFGWAHYAGLTPSNPAQHLARRVRPKGGGVRHHVWLTEAEVVKLLQTTTQPDIVARRDRAVLALGLFSGLRVHEIAELTWGNLRSQQGTVNLIGKGSKAATLSLPPNLRDELSTWRGLCAHGAGAPVPEAHHVIIGCPWTVRGDGATGVCTPTWGKRISTQSLRRIVHEHGTRIGYPSLAPHDLRRSYAGLLEAKGVPMRVIQKMLRHTSIATTERYLAENPVRDRDEINAAIGQIAIGGPT
jgi:integrase